MGSSRWLSTVTREAEEAARFLGRPFAISGLVRHGKRLGSSRLGAPTVNLIPDPRQLVPAFGVYAARVTVDGAVRPAVTNLQGGGGIRDHLLLPGDHRDSHAVLLDVFDPHDAVTNVGVRPTVDTDGGVTVESHLLEPIGELYGADCRCFCGRTGNRVLPPATGPGRSPPA